MRIAIWHNLPSGGAKRALYYHVKGLIERGHTIESWCPPTADQSFLPLGDLIREHVVPMTRYSKVATNPVSQLLVLYRMTVGKMKALGEHCRRCAEEIEQGGFDLLFANTAMDYAVAPIARQLKIPKSIYLQEPYRLLYEASPVLPWSMPSLERGWWHRPSETSSFVFDFLAVQWLRVQAREEYCNAAAFDSILVNSLYSRESVERVYGLDAWLCPLGIDTTVFTNRCLPREPFVVGLGAITPNKKVQFVIDALGHMQAPRPRLVWIGNGARLDYLRELESLAVSLGVDFSPRVKVTDEELVDVLNRAAIMAYAPRLEPFGFAPLEAGACGLPVVAVAEAGVRETVIHGENGLLVENDPSAMAQALQSLLENQPLARKLGENGCRRVAEQWSLERANDHLEQRLKETVEKRSAYPMRSKPSRTDYWKAWTE